MKFQQINVSLFRRDVCVIKAFLMIQYCQIPVLRSCESGHYCQLCYFMLNF